MDYIVTWSPAALDDVDAIADFIAQDSPAYAIAVVDKIIDASRKLRNSPKASRVVPELADPDIRDAEAGSAARLSRYASQKGASAVGP